MPFSAVISEFISDTNYDGGIDIRDVTVIQSVLAEFDEPPEDYPERADVDCNGVLDINDATHLQKYLAEFDVVLGKK